MAAPAAHPSACPNTLVAEHLRLADNLAHRFACSGEPREDLVQVARLGLVLAARRFDPSTGVPFPAFATPTIRGELRRHLRDHAWGVRPPRKLQELRPQVVQTAEQLAQRWSRTPTTAELAREMQLPTTVVAEVLALDSAYRPDSLDVTGPGSGAPAEVLQAPSTRLDEVEGRVDLEPSLAALPESSRRVLRLRYTDEWSQQRIAAAVGVSQMQISRLLRQSLNLVRQGLVPSHN
ncbi:MAG: sigma-70 family RNA polymerase sigma factor [Ornithinimicrobium sp.]